MYKDLANGDVKKEDRRDTKIPELKDRVIKPIEITLKFIREDFIRSSYGNGYFYKPKDSFLESISSISKDCVNDWMLDNSQTKGVYKNKIIFSNKKIKNQNDLCFSIKSPWFEISRSVQIQGNESVIEETITLLTDYIKNDDLKKNEFISAQKKIMENYGEYVIYFED